MNLILDQRSHQTFICDLIKNTVYADFPTTIKECQQKTRDAVESITRNQLRIASMRRVFSLVNRCLEVNGAHFEFF